VQLFNDEGQELRFVDTRSFGQMWWVPPGEPVESVITGLQKLGPEPFSEAFSGAYLRERLKGSSRPIKNALLDQSLVAGVGNIYADESLFAAGIQPSTPSGRVSLSRLNGLHQALVEVLKTSIGAGGTTFSDFRDLTAATAITAAWLGCIGEAANPAAAATPPFAATSSAAAVATGAPAASIEHLAVEREPRSRQHRRPGAAT
jgi:DNA-formamidopyrimidine glycosylase